MAGHTPWRYIVHKQDGPLARAWKRIGRWFWEVRRGW